MGVPILNDKPHIIWISGDDCPGDHLSPSWLRCKVQSSWAMIDFASTPASPLDAKWRMGRGPMTCFFSSMGVPILHLFATPRPLLRDEIKSKVDCAHLNHQEITCLGRTNLSHEVLKKGIESIAGYAVRDDLTLPPKKLGLEDDSWWSTHWIWPQLYV